MSEQEKAKCDLCGEDMPAGEEMFKIHGYSGDCPAPPLKKVDSTSDARTVNNVVRHEYRVLSDAEKAQVKAIKDKGAEMIGLIQSIPLKMPHGPASAELIQAQIKVEEAVFWAVKHITA